MASADSPESPQQGIKSIETAARVLLALEAARGPRTLSEVARGSDIHPAKAHRYLTSLVRTGLAAQDAATGMYDLGPASRHLGVEALRRGDPVRTASNFAIDLRDETGHTVNLAVWGDAGPTMVGWDTGAHLLPITIRIGSTLPLLDSAVGYVFMTHLPGSTTADALAAQQRSGSTRKAAKAEIEEIKREVRADGYGRTKNQMIFGLSALAAPIFGATGELELVIGLILPAQMMTAAGSKSLGVTLRETAVRASQELGYIE